MGSPVEEIKRRLRIEEVIGSYIELKPAGKALKALCPFHSEKTPSFMVSPERQSFYCFGCNKGGDMFTFVEEFEGVDFKGALKILAEKAHVDLSQYDSLSRGRVDKKRADQLFMLLKEATKYYAEELKKHEPATTYLLNRGLTQKTIESFTIGFAPDSWDSILNHLRGRGYSDTEIKDAGLAIKKEDGGYYDRFRNRIMFPIADSSGRVVAFSGRTLEKDPDVAKYINSPETELFKKRDTLFGIDKAKQAIRKFKFSILVEGQMDLVLSHQAGFSNTVATSGTALGGNETGRGGVSNLELVRRISKNIVLAFDSDAAGKAAAIKNARYALSLDMDVKIAELPEGKDPADIIRDDKNAWKHVIRSAKNVVLFHLGLIQAEAANERDVLKRVRTDLFETLRAVQSKIEREHYINVLAENLGVREETLLEEFNDFLQRLPQRKAANERGQNESNENKEGSDQNQNDQRALLAAHLFVYGKDPEVDLETHKRFEEDFFSIFNASPDEVLSEAPVALRERHIFEIEADAQTALEQQSHIRHLIQRTTIGALERKAHFLLRKLRDAEGGADRDAASALFHEYSAVLKKIEALKQQS
jgi:DNA primase